MKHGSTNYQLLVDGTSVNAFTQVFCVREHLWWGSAFYNIISRILSVLGYMDNISRIKLYLRHRIMRCNEEGNGVACEGVAKDSLSFILILDHTIAELK